jgi:hypothetical protein
MTRIRKKRDDDAKPIIGYLKPELIDIHGRWHCENGEIYNLIEGNRLVFEVRGVKRKENLVVIGSAWMGITKCVCGAEVDPLAPLLVLESASMYPATCCGEMVIIPHNFDVEFDEDDDYWRIL